MNWKKTYNSVLEASVAAALFGVSILFVAWVPFVDIPLDVSLIEIVLGVGRLTLGQIAVMSFVIGIAGAGSVIVLRALYIADPRRWEVEHVE
jgi:hypothetical protein